MNAPLWTSNEAAASLGIAAPARPWTASGVSIDTVRSIDEYLGLSERHDERLMDATVSAVRDGWSVRQLAKNSDLSKTTAHRYLQKARSVLVEIGEVQS